MSNLFVKPSDVVIVKSVTDKSCYVLKVDGEQKLGKSRVVMKDVIGQPYTTYYELKGRKFQKIEDTADAAEEVDNEDEIGTAAESAEGLSGVVEPDQAPNVPNDLQQQFNSFSNQDIKHYLDSITEKNASVKGVRGDNSFYVDTNTAQKLSDTDIAKLREGGLSGADIIKTLIENSDTFAYKSDFAQEKWIKRKERKYRKKYQVIKATPVSICEASFTRNKEKICNIRFDSLAQVISQAGVYAGCHVMVIESTVGLVTGTVAYRMRGEGRILSVYGTQQPHIDIARYFNLDKASIDIIEPIPAVDMGPAARDVAALGFSDLEFFSLPEATKPVTETSTATTSDIAMNEELDVAETIEIETAEEEADLEIEEEEAEERNNKKRKLAESAGETKQEKFKDKKKNKNSTSHICDQITSTGRSPEAQIRVKSYLRQGVDRLIIAARFRPLPILKVALYLLAPSSSFVIYHEFLEPLVECYLYLQEQELALRLVLSDTWMREFQTLPGRTRPDMFMSTSGGFLLSGIYVGMVPRPFLVDNTGNVSVKTTIDKVDKV